MSELQLQHKKSPYKLMRDHDYLFDGTYTVAGEKDHGKMINKAAMATAEMAIVPIYEHMFSDLSLYPRNKRAYIPNAHLPDHLDLTYKGRLYPEHRQSTTMISGKERYKYFTLPKLTTTIATSSVLELPPDRHSSIQISPKTYLVDKSVQTIIRDSSVQTDPYQPDYVIKEGCKTVPEVLLLDEINIGVEDVLRGVDVSVVQWVNRQRAKRAWLEFKSNFSILGELEYHEQRHREKDIEDMLIKNMESSDYILEIQSKLDTGKTNRMWIRSNEKLEKHFEKIKKSKERDIRKLESKNFTKRLKSQQNTIRWPPFVLPKATFVTINTDFIPSFDQMNIKQILVEKNMYQNHGCRKKNRAIELKNDTKKSLTICQSSQ